MGRNLEDCTRKAEEFRDAAAVNLSPAVSWIHQTEPNKAHQKRCGKELFPGGAAERSEALLLAAPAGICPRC